MPRRPRRSSPALHVRDRGAGGMPVLAMTGTWIDHHDDRPARLRDPWLGSEPCLHPHSRIRASRLGAWDEAFFTWRRDAGCRIGHDVWIGHNAAIMPGISVGIGAVIGTGAIVTRDVAPYAIAVGVPARVIRHRFDPPTVERLLASRWWDWDEDRIRADIDLLCDPAALLAREDG